jgi:hypothetical protein
VITDDQIAALNPEMATTWIVGVMPLSDAQRRVLAIACRNGGFVAAGTGSHRGRVERVPASALLALVRRGYLTHCYGSEGGVAGRLSESARDKLAECFAPAGTGQACGAANDCARLRGHAGKHRNRIGQEW